MTKIVYDLNKSTLEAKKFVAYTIVSVSEQSIDLEYTRLFKTRKEARTVVNSLNDDLGEKQFRVAKTIFVHP